MHGVLELIEFLKIRVHSGWQRRVNPQSRSALVPFNYIYRATQSNVGRAQATMERHMAVGMLANSPPMRPDISVPNPAASPFWVVQQYIPLGLCYHNIGIR